jgi:hypothetical protein
VILTYSYTYTKITGTDYRYIAAAGCRTPVGSIWW